jgi:uncharacterized surface protein with fasciclin (FAS1) repeats
MLRYRLLTAAAATALLAAPAAFAQTPPTQTPPAEATPPVPTPTPDPVQPATPAPTQAVTPATPATPASPAAAAQAATAPTPVQANNVIDVLTAQGNFTTLLSALDQAQLTDTLKSRPAISIFAPTDEAFAALPEAERTRLMDPANAQELRNLLLYHVIVADVSSAQIDGAKGGVETASRTQVLLDGTGDAIKVDGATVTRADIDASNGAVFAIDKVLNPAQSMAAMGDEEAATPAPADETAPAEEAAPPTEAAPPVTPPTEAPTPAPTPMSTPTPTPAPTAVPPGATATTTPAAPGVNAPGGQPAATTTTIAAPPVPNPTDGQVDAQPDPSQATPPVQTPDPSEDDAPTPPAEPEA